MFPLCLKSPFPAKAIITDVREALMKETSISRIQLPPELVKMLAGEDWTYFDLPGFLSPECYESVLEIFGDGNYQIMVITNGENPQPWKRSQFFLNGEARRRMKEYVSQSLN